MSRKHRASSPRRKRSRLAELRLPPWLFYTLIVLAALAALAVLAMGVVNMGQE